MLPCEIWHATSFRNPRSESRRIDQRPDQPGASGGSAMSPGPGHRSLAVLAADSSSRPVARLGIFRQCVVGLRVRVDLVGTHKLLVHLVAGGGRVAPTCVRLVL